MQHVAALAALSDDALDERAMEEVPALISVLSASSTRVEVSRAAQRVLRRMASTCSPREVVLALLASCGGGGSTLGASARVTIVSLLGAALARVRQRRRAPLLRDAIDAIASFVCDGPAAERAPWEADEPPHVAALADDQFSTYLHTKLRRSVLKTHHGFVMDPGLRIHLKSMRNRREIVN